MLFDRAVAAADASPSYSGIGVVIGTAIILVILAALAIWVLLAARLERRGHRWRIADRERRPQYRRP